MEGPFDIASDAAIWLPVTGFVAMATTLLAHPCIEERSHACIFCACGQYPAGHTALMDSIVWPVLLLPCLRSIAGDVNDLTSVGAGVRSVLKFADACWQVTRGSRRIAQRS